MISVTHPSIFAFNLIEQGICGMTSFYLAYAAAIILIGKEA